jgi:hypothetical protein
MQNRREQKYIKQAIKESNEYRDGIEKEFFQELEKERAAKIQAQLKSFQPKNTTGVGAVSTQPASNLKNRK